MRSPALPPAVHRPGCDYSKRWPPQRTLALETTLCPTAPIGGSTSSSRSRPGWPPPQDDTSQQLHTDVLPTLGSVPGVAGALSPSAPRAAIRRPEFSPRFDYRITTCYLDDDPATVGDRLAPVLERILGRHVWRGPVLDAPFESMMIWDWDRFGS